MNSENIHQYPIRYFSIVTVPKEFSPDISRFDTKCLQEGAPSADAVMGELAKIREHATSLTPYLFALFEVEGGKACWTYFDLAGSLSRVQFIDGGSFVLAEKVAYPGGAYSYDVKAVLLERK